ncbi:MAG: hypothetical protein IKY68_01340 [Alistipes sp.]|nr:hypothetical protein [Alistipes sp.]
MKKIFWYMMALALIGCAFTACNDDEDKVVPVALEVVKSDVDFAAAGGVGTIQIKSVEATVTATADQPWVTINNANAKAVNFTVAESGESLIRTATITIKAGAASQAVSILQSPATMVMENQTITVDPTGQTATTITYETSMTSAPVVTIPADATWLKVTAEAGKLSFIPDTNVTGDRETIVTVEQGWKPVQFTVKQEIAYLIDFYVDVLDRDAVTIECTPTEYMALTSGNWDVQSPNDWITITKTETGCSIDVTENTSGNVRTGMVQILMDGQVIKSYPVDQKIYSYKFFLGNWTFTHDQGSLTVTIRENVPGESYYVDGLYRNNVVFGYEVVDDIPRLTLVSQYVCPASDGVHHMWICLRDAAKAIYSWANGKFVIPYNMDENNQTLTFTDEGHWNAVQEGYVAHGFGFYKFTGVEANSNTATGSYYKRFTYAQTFTR